MGRRGRRRRGPGDARRLTNIPWTHAGRNGTLWGMSMNWTPIMPAIVFVRSKDAGKIGKRQAFVGSAKSGTYQVEPYVRDGKVAWSLSFKPAGSTASYAYPIGKSATAHRTATSPGGPDYASSVAAIRAAESHETKSAAQPVPARAKKSSAECACSARRKTSRRG